MSFALITRGTGTDFSTVNNAAGEFEYPGEWDTETAVDMPASVLQASGNGIEIPLELDGELWEAFWFGNYGSHTLTVDGRTGLLYDPGVPEFMSIQNWDNWETWQPMHRSGLISVNTGDEFRCRARIFTGTWTMNDVNTHMALVDSKRAGFLRVAPSGDTNSASQTDLIWGTPDVNTMDANVSGSDITVPAGVQGAIVSINHRHVTINTGNGNFRFINNGVAKAVYQWDALQERAPGNGFMGVHQVVPGQILKVDNAHTSTPGVDADSFGLHIEWLP